MFAANTGSQAAKPVFLTHNTGRRDGRPPEYIPNIYTTVFGIVLVLTNQSYSRGLIPFFSFCMSKNKNLNY